LKYSKTSRKQLGAEGQTSGKTTPKRGISETLLTHLNNIALNLVWRVCGGTWSFRELEESEGLPLSIASGL
jgi:hypothetical protein